MGQHNEDAVEIGSKEPKLVALDMETRRGFFSSMDATLVAMRKLVCDEHTARIDQLILVNQSLLGALKTIQAIATNGPEPESVDTRLVVEQVRHLKATAASAAASAQNNVAPMSGTKPTCGDKLQFQQQGKLMEITGPCVKEPAHVSVGDKWHHDSNGNRWQ